MTDANTQIPLGKWGVQLQPNFESSRPANEAKVAVIMGSRSDLEPCMQHCIAKLEVLEIPYECGIVSAHRTPRRMMTYAEQAETRGIQIIIACAGGSAHLQGMVAGSTTLQVLGVAPKKDDEAAFWSQVRMPSGVPLAFMGSGKPGAENAVLQALRALAVNDEMRHDQLVAFIRDQTADVPLTCYDEGDDS